jgi:hypothetical protein
VHLPTLRPRTYADLPLCLYRPAAPQNPQNDFVGPTRSNPEIGAQLFLSPRTVEWHMRKVFAKLGISSRRELELALGAKRLTAQPV